VFEMKRGDKDTSTFVLGAGLKKFCFRLPKYFCIPLCNLTYIHIKFKIVHLQYLQNGMGIKLKLLEWCKGEDKASISCLEAKKEGILVFFTGLRSA